MEKIKLGNFALIKMGVREYDEAYEADMQALCRKDLESIVWIEKYDENGDIVAMSAENMFVFADKTFAHTSRHACCEANLYTCLEAISWMEEL